MTPDPERYSRVSELFQDAAELPPSERKAWLDEHCGEDSGLRQEVEALLAADPDADGFMEKPIAAIPDDLFPPDADDHLAGQRFGPYEVIREIGRGGLGTVHLAARADDAYRKEVALKLLRRGVDTDDVLRRFRNERQILAQLDHPNIARLLDGGTSDDGRPFFVMEHVKGEPLIRFCETHEFSLKRRLELFRKVCAAVAYAHQNLVIHRDIKPSNILVTDDGTPKLLDFGIAKIVAPEDELMTQTIPALRVMTPEYASPEQIKGGAITTSSDAYSLGVLLYELLTGQKPYRVSSRTTEAMSRAITEQEPPRPSTAVATRASDDNQHSEPGNQKLLRGDLDNIVLMALRKEPERRYQSVESFSEDIRRHLVGLPVSAHKDTVSYRAAKFIRRHKTGVAAALLVALALFSGLIATLWQARVAQAQRAKAERRFSDVRKLANSNLFDVYPKIEKLAGSLDAQQAVLLNVLQYLDSLSREASDDLELQSELATAYERVGDVQGAKNDQSLGNYKTGLETYLKAQQLREAVSRADPRNLEAKTKLAQNYYVTARTYWFADRTKEAEAIYTKGVKLRRELLAASPNSVEANNGLAIMLINAGTIPEYGYQTTEALVYFDEALAIISKMRAQHPENRDLKKTLSLDLKYLGRAKAALREYDEAQSYLQQALAISQELAQEAPQDFRLQRDVWVSQKQVCQFFINKDDGAGAVPACLPTTEFPRLALEKEPENATVQHDLSVSQWDVARAFNLAKNYSSALEAANESIATISQLTKKLPENTIYRRYRAIYLTAKGEALLGLNQFDPALAILREAERILRRLSELDPESTTHPWDLSGVYRLAAKAHSAKGEKAAAVENVEMAIAIVQTLAKLDALSGAEQKLLAELEAEKCRAQQDVTRRE